MKVTLQVNGREMSFSEQWVKATLEEYLTNLEATKIKVLQKPTEGEWFEVKPRTIDQKLFKEKRKDEEQEYTRLLILEAFCKMDQNLERYGKSFKTMMPKKTWTCKTTLELKEMACKLGDHNADWIEQALEWAQRIANGETWEDVCNAQDTANWFRLVIWRNGRGMYVGGSVYADCRIPATFRGRTYNDNCDCYDVVPLVVRYE